MNKTLSYLVAFTITVITLIFSIEYIKNKPIEVREVTLSNGIKTVKLEGMLHLADPSFFQYKFDKLAEYEKSNYDIITEGYGADENNPLDKFLLIVMSQKIDNCVYFSKNINNKLTHHIEYEKKININYTKYIKDVDIDNIILQMPEKTSKNYICFDELDLEGLRFYTRYKRLFLKNNEKYGLIYNRDINFTNEILLSKKLNVAVFVGDTHLDFIIELLEKTGYKITDIKYKKAF